MGIRQKVHESLQYIRQHLSRRVVLVSLLLISFVTYLIIFAPRTVAFSYGGDNCVGQLTLFPKLLKAEANSLYQLSIEDTVSIAGYPVIGRKVCAIPLAAPKQGKVKLSVSPLGWILARKTFIINTPEAPRVSVASLGASIPVAESVNVPISTKDIVYDYDLAAGDARTTCQSTDKALACDISQMKLIQGQSYALKIVRHFNEFRETVGEKQVKVLDPVKVEQSSVRPDQVIYDKPSTFTIQTDKAIETAKAVLERVEGDKVTEERATVAVADKQITVTPATELIREASYRLKLTYTKGVDGSVLEEPYSVPFQVSGGPKATSVNIASSGVTQGQTIIVQFDQPIKAGQNIAQFVHVNGNDSASISKDGDKVYVRLNGVGTCTSFTIAVAKGLESEYGVVSKSGWQFSSRTRCSTITTIGYSVKNRPINAYSFGSGSSVILFTGAIHGDELSGKYVMDNWISYLEEHAPEIPQDRRVVIVPSVSPDGVAAGTRNNAHGVNLNRNFATSNWSTDTELAGGRIEKGGGGSSAMSEPESVALAGFTQRLQPRFVVSYHSQGSLVNSNDVGIAAALGPKYASMTGYRFVASTATSDAFDYNVTGTYEDWLGERGTPAILIELPTHTGRYFSRNTEAMWAMVRG